MTGFTVPYLFELGHGAMTKFWRGHIYIKKKTIYVDIDQLNFLPGNIYHNCLNLVQVKQFVHWYKLSRLALSLFQQKLLHMAGISQSIKCLGYVFTRVLNALFQCSARQYLSLLKKRSSVLCWFPYKACHFAQSAFSTHVKFMQNSLILAIVEQITIQIT